jgi:hypothetical protein
VSATAPRRATYQPVPAVTRAGRAIRRHGFTIAAHGAVLMLAAAIVAPLVAWLNGWN